MRRCTRLVLAAVVVGSCSAAPGAQGEDARALLDRAMADFRAGRVAESVVGFDRVARLAPQAMPELWQRGIALYYVDRFRDCRQQFEAHRTVNPADVENAAWHYLCVARDESPRVARGRLLPVGPDSREPMREIYQMFAGQTSVESVLAAGARAVGNNPRARFYAALYAGLYMEAQGDRSRAETYMRMAASEQFAGVAGYMHDVARVHMQVRKWPLRAAAGPTKP